MSLRRLRLLLVPAVLAAVLVGGRATVAAPTCTITWDGPATGGTWQTPANWNPDRLPASADVVCIGGGNIVAYPAAAGTTTITTLLAQGTLSVTGGSLNTTGTGADSSSVADLSLSLGTVGGAGTLGVGGTFTWTGGTMDGAGTTRVEPGATLVRDGANTTFLANGRVLEVLGTLDVRSNAIVNTSGAPAPLVKSSGTVVKSAGGTGTAQILAPLENDGVVRSDAGTLELRGGDGAGESSGDTGAAAATGTVRFAFGTFDLGNGARLLGSASITGGTVNVAAAATATASGSNSITGGTLGGTGTLDVTGGALTWTGGTMDGAGTTKIEAAATLVRDGPATVFLANGRVLDVLGTLDLKSDQITNPAGAVAPLIRSTGTVVKSAGAGTAQIFTAFENDGVVRSDSGILELRGGDGPGSSDGDAGAPGAPPRSVRFAGGTFDLDDGARLLGGASVDGGTVNVAAGATATASGSNSLTAGTLGGTGTLDVSGTMNWTAASMTGSGTTRITPTATLVRDGETAVFLSAGRLLELQGTLDLRTDRLITPSGAASLLRNTGTVVKSAGAGVATISTPFENDGVVRSDSGALELLGGDGPGTSAGQAGAPGAVADSVRLVSGTFDLVDGAQLRGGVTVNGATVNVAAGGTATASGSNKLASGTVGGTGTLGVTGTLTWTAGSMSDAGTTRIGPTATLAAEGTGTLFLANSRLLEVQGTLDLRSDRLLTSSGGPEPLLHNTGTVLKSAGAGVATISAALENDGVVKSNVGVIELRGGDGPGSSAGDLGSAAPTGTVRVDFGNYDLAAGARLLGGDTISNGRLTIADGATVPMTGANVFSGGTIDGAGTLSIEGPLSWSGGTMSGAGQTKVPVGVELRLATGCCAALGGTRRLVNDGTIVLEGADLGSTGAPRIENNGRLRFAGPAGGESVGSGGLLLNAGTIEKTAGTGSSSVTMQLANAGTVTSASGAVLLTLGDGAASQSGDFGATGSGTVDFENGEWDLGPGTRFTGGVVISSGDLTIPAGYELPVAGSAKLESGGQLLGLGTVEIKGTLAWDGGRMMDGGLTVVDPGAELTVSGADPHRLDGGRRLFNNGTIRWTGAGSVEALDYAFLNAGLFDLQSDADLDGDSGSGLLHNIGTIRKSGGAGESTFTASIDNDGTIEAASGTLAVGPLENYSQASDSLTAGAYVARGAVLVLDEAEPLAANAATFVLDGAAAHVRTRTFSGDPAVEALGGLARNLGAGEIRLDNGATLDTTTALRNAGLVTVAKDAKLKTGGIYRQAGGRTELTSPTARIEAPAYEQTAGALRVVAAPTGVGRLAVAGTASLGGTLLADTLAGFTPAAGATFRFLDAGARTGSFTSVVKVAPGIDYAVDYDAAGAQLRTLGAPVVADPRAPTAETPSALDDRALAILNGPWTRKSAPGFYGGTYTMSSKRGARLVRAGIEARRLVLLVSSCRGCGSLEAYWNGRRLRRVELRGRPLRRRVTLASFPAVQTGTLVLQVASHRQVRVDGLVVRR